MTTVVTCWYCQTDPAGDHPHGEKWALCDVCKTKPTAVQATERMNEAQSNYITTRVSAFKWRDWDRNNLGDWNSDIKEAMPTKEELRDERTD